MSEESPVIDEFPDEVVEDVDGLIWLGYLEDEFDFCEHTFVIRTLRGEEELHAALVSKEYVETIGQSRAWVWAQIALAVQSIDGDADFCPPIGPSKRADYARARFQYVTRNWYWPTAEYVFSRYSMLLERQARALQATQDLSTRSRPTFTALADFSTGRADLGEELKRELED